MTSQPDRAVTGGPPPAPTRVFRADTPSDVVCACLVADALPAGWNVLALCPDSSADQPGNYRACLEALAGLHPWQSVVDLTGVSVYAGGPGAFPAWRRWRSFRRRLWCVQELRARLGPPPRPQGPPPSPGGSAAGPVDELYLAYLLHEDVRALCTAFPGARRYYYPHTLASLMRCEVGDYAPVCSEAARPVSVAARLADALKRACFGRDAVPCRFLRIDGGFTFAAQPPWAPRFQDLRHKVTPPAIRQLFARLPAAVQSHYRALAARCGERVGVLLLAPEDRWQAGEAEVYVHLARHLLRGGARSLLVKPHSRSSTGWLDEITRRLAGQFPGVTVGVAREHHCYPAELVLAPFALAGYAGMATTSLVTLRRLYGGNSFCAEEALRRAYAGSPAKLGFLERYVADCASEYVAV